MGCGCDMHQKQHLRERTEITETARYPAYRRVATATGILVIEADAVRTPTVLGLVL